jgi:hypothetical protein
VYQRLDYSQDMDRRVKKEIVHDRLGKRVVDQDLANYEGEEYVWQDGQWCPGGLTRSQKRRGQRLRNQELREEKHQVWHAKQTVDKGAPSTNIDAIFILATEFRATGNQEDECTDDEEKPAAQLVFQAESVIFNKPEKHLT